MTRREFLALSTAVACGSAMPAAPRFAFGAESGPEPFLISLAEWSLVKSIRAGKLTNLLFPHVARTEFGIDCVEFVDQFFADKAQDKTYLGELKQRAEDDGVRLGLIMLDTNGPLGAADEAERAWAVENTRAWIDAAVFLGCVTVRVNARGAEQPEELARLVADSCAQLADYAAPRGINVVIENHGGPSSDPAWLTGVVRTVGKPNFGTLPDFGNFPPEIDRYDAVEALMPHAKAVSAKAMGFTDGGDVAETDFHRMMRIVRDAGYTGYVGVESGATEQQDEAEAVHKTRALLLRIREDFKQRLPMFNGQDLAGWVVVEGGDWTFENGELIGRNGRNWSTNPEVTGSWLRTEREYEDFRLELQYAINEAGNSGVFFRSAAEKNPAFTGYEMQIVDDCGAPPSKQGATALYDLAAPSENRVREAGQWNTVTITARRDRIVIEMNGRTVLDTVQTRSRKGFIGLQNHDEHAVVRFRNVRVQRL